VTVFKVVCGDQSFFVACSSSELARVLVVENHPEIGRR
jgi:hypothetical protein